jgi:hypothetical protein
VAERVGVIENCSRLIASVCQISPTPSTLATSPAQTFAAIGDRLPAFTAFAGVMSLGVSLVIRLALVSRIGAVQRPLMGRRRRNAPRIASSVFSVRMELSGGFLPAYLEPFAEHGDGELQTARDTEL